jgi:hypothetical protein
MAARKSLAERLFTGVYPAGIVYADRSRSPRGPQGDYARVAFLPYMSLVLEVTRGEEQSDLLPLIRKDAERMAARRGERFPIDASGHTVVLGGGKGRATGRTAGRSHGVTPSIPGNRGKGWEYYARRSTDSKIVKITPKVAREIYEKGPKGSYEYAWAQLYEVPPMYVRAREGLFRVEKGFISPSWTWTEGRRVGGLRGEDPGTFVDFDAGRRLFAEALPLIESASVREFAEKNREKFEELALLGLAKRCVPVTLTMRSGQRSRAKLRSSSALRSRPDGLRGRRRAIDGRLKKRRTTMTMKLTIKNEDLSRTAVVKTIDFNPADSDASRNTLPTTETEITPGTAAEFWIHQGRKLDVMEKP